MSFEDDSAMRAGLRKPFPDEMIGKLPKVTDKGGDKSKCTTCGNYIPRHIHVDYVGHAAITDRLNEFAPGWNYRIDEVMTIEGSCWIRGTMIVGGVSRPEYGQGGDPQKALGNFIRRGAMRFGVGIDHWSKEDLLTSDDSGTRAEGALSSGTTSDGPGPLSEEPGARTASGNSSASPSDEGPAGPSEDEAEREGAPGGGSEPIAYGEGATDPSPPGAAPSMESLWADLHLCYGTTVKIVGHVNHVCGTKYKGSEADSIPVGDLERTLTVAKGDAA